MSNRWESLNPMSGFVIRFDGEKNNVFPQLFGDGDVAEKWAAKLIEPGETVTIIEVREVSRRVIGTPVVKKSMPLPPMPRKV